jgi:hypothetical protein
MSRRDAQTRDPMDCLIAAGEVKDAPSQLALEVGLHVQQLKAQHR